ncbi:ABC transporter substrate-binding protein [Virgibacillus byunsanensis]|uniref:ABC transporter substrate-binding protein n=1 Tax=Virgibacillus byunsanensis TaxID=570945 RepID=A0ABW3LI74_9BACI
MKNKINFLSISVCFMFFLLFVAGCSSASNSDGEDSGSDSGSDSGADVDTVKVAVIAPLTGPFAQNGENVVKGTELAIEEINNNGGIKSLDGAHLELITADAGSADPSHAASVTRRVIQENPDLTAVIGLWASAYTVAASTVTEQEKIPMLSQSFTDEITDRGYEYVFQFPEKASVMGELAVDALMDLSQTHNQEIKTVAIVADNQSSNKTVGQATAKQFKELGVDVPVEEYYQPGITDATSMSTKILNPDPDLVYVGGAIADVSMIMKTLRGMGYEGTFLGNGGAYVIKEFKEATGDAGNGSFATVGWNWDFPYDGAEEFNQKYMDEFDEPFAPQEAGEDYAMVYALKEALETAGTSNPEEVRDAVANLDIPSIMTGGNISFDETGMNADVIPALVEWIDGVPRTVYPKEISSTEPIFKVN